MPSLNWSHALVYAVPIISYLVATFIARQSRSEDCRKMHDWKIVVYPVGSAMVTSIIWMLFDKYIFFVAGLIYGVLASVFSVGVYFVVHVLTKHRY